MNRKKLRTLQFISLIMVLLISLLPLCGCGRKRNGGMTAEDYEKVTNPAAETRYEIDPTATTPVELPENPINFSELRKINTDLYAWIYIPNTEIDYVVAQSSQENDNFYLHHNYRGNYEFAGTIYSQRHNTKYFIDRVTVLYGHNMLNGSMFAQLHKFADEDFFEENEYVYIYTKGHILTYKVFFAGEYDNRHILNSFDFSDEKVYEEYLYDALHPRYANCNVRDMELTTDDRILVLSTCTDYNSSLRFLVQGVLINDQPTK